MYKNFANCDNLSSNVVQLEGPNTDLPLPDCSTRHHFKPYSQWRMFTIKDSRAIPGLKIIPNILVEDTKVRSNWYDYFHDALPLKAEDYQLKSNILLKEKSQSDNLRWITFGYHHNWDSKMYKLDQPTVVIPDRIKDLCKVVMTFLDINFTAQAGIVNYYNRKSSLCFHTDHSELDHSIPLLSFSLGAPAIFLIGGLSKEAQTPIVPILLGDSDVMIMSGESRLALHAVPRIVVDKGGSDVSHRKKKKSIESGSGSEKLPIQRINVNVRQVV